MAVAPKTAAVKAADVKRPDWYIEEGKLVNLHTDRNVCFRSVLVLYADDKGLYVKMDPINAPYTETAYFPYSSIIGVGVVAARA